MPNIISLLLSISLTVLLASCGGERRAVPPDPQEPIVVPPPPEVVPENGTMASLVGTYRLVSLNGESGMVARLRIVAGSEVGILVEALPNSPKPIENLSILTPKGHTNVEQAGNHFTQKYIVSEEEKTIIEYDLTDEGLAIESVECRPGICTPTSMVAEKES